MFTKKIALFGLAGLTVLSMSCSDTEDGEPGGSFSTAPNAIDKPAGVEFSAGTIKANEGAEVVKVTVTANNVAVDFSTQLDLPAAEVDLTGEGLKSICAALNSSTTIPSVAIVVNATFSLGEPISSPAGTLTNYACGGGSPTIEKSKMDFSTTGASFADVDAGKTYKTEDITTAATAKLIDVLARYSATVTGDKIRTPFALFNDDIEVAAAGSDDIFWDLFEAACPSGDVEACGDAGIENLGPYGIFGWQLDATATGVLTGATTWDQLESFIPMMNVVTENQDPVFEFSGAGNTSFLLFTSKGEMVAVIVSATGNTATTITLNGISMQ